MPMTIPMRFIPLYTLVAIFPGVLCVLARKIYRNEKVVIARQIVIIATAVNKPSHVGGRVSEKIMMDRANIPNILDLTASAK